MFPKKAILRNAELTAAKCSVVRQYHHDSSAKFWTMDRIRYILANMNDYRPTVTHAKNVQMKDAQLAIAIDITNLSMQSLVKLLKSRLRETLIDSKDSKIYSRRRENM